MKQKNSQLYKYKQNEFIQLIQTQQWQYQNIKTNKNSNILNVISFYHETPTTYFSHKNSQLYKYTNISMTTLHETHDINEIFLKHNSRK